MNNATQTEPVNGMAARGNPEPQLRMAQGVPAAVFLMVNTLETGGSERQFAALARDWDLSSFSLHLGCLREEGALLEDLGPLSPFGLGGSLYSAESFRSRIRLARHLRQHDIAIAHSFDFYTNLVLIPVARLAGVPVVIGSQRQIGDLLTPRQSWVQARVFRWCDKVVCNSQAAAQRLREQGIAEDKLVVIGNGLPPSAFAGTSPALPPVPGLLRVGMIARMNHRVKNQHGFLRAAARVAAKFPAVEFVLVGDGPFRAEIEGETQTLGLVNQVRFLGDRRDVPAVLASLDVTVLPSSSESLSNSIIESMAAGVPVVAYRVGGNPELIGNDRGVLVNAGDEAGLVSAIELLLRDQGLRKSLGRNARAYAQANFTIEQMRRNHEELYIDLLERKGRRRKGRHRAQES